MRRTLSTHRRLWTSLGAIILSIALVSAIAFALPEPLPDPLQADPPSTEVARISIDTRQPAGTTINLPKAKYMLIARGQYTYGGSPTGPFWADAECSFVPGVGIWVRNQYPTNSPGGDPVDLLVDEKHVEWTFLQRPGANSPAASLTSKTETPECDSRPVPEQIHEYFIVLTWAGGPLKLRVDDLNTLDNSGFFEVIIRKEGVRSKEELIATLAVPSVLSEGVSTPPLLVGQTYRLEVTGAYRYATPRYSDADAECSTQPTNLEPAPKFAYPGVVNTEDLLDLHVTDHVYNGIADGNVAWQPLAGGLPGSCATDPNRTYSFGYVAQDPLGQIGREVTRLTLKVFDTSYFDNGGALIVKLFQVIEISIPAVEVPDPNEGIEPPGQPFLDPPIPTPDLVSVQPSQPECVRDSLNQCLELVVPANDPDGVTTPLNLPAGTYTVRASGTYFYEFGTEADAECSRGPAAIVFTGDPTWQRNRFAYLSIGRDPLDLMVADRDHEWRPVGNPNPLGCHDETDPEEHSYEMEFNWAGDAGGNPAPIKFHIYDPGDYTRNTGSIVVRLFQTQSGESGQLLTELLINSSDPNGTLTLPLLAGQKYRFEVSGTYIYYRFSSNGFEADAECSRKGDFTFGDATMDAPGWQPHRFGHTDPTGGDPQDVYVSDLIPDNFIFNGPATWKPTEPGDGEAFHAACTADKSHKYTLTVIPEETGPFQLWVYERQFDWYMDNLGLLLLRVFLD